MMQEVKINELDVEQVLKPIQNSRILSFPVAAFPAAVVALFSINLSYLLQGGVSLRAALELLQRSEPSSRFKRLIIDLGNSVNGGSMLSMAMRNHPTAFGDVTIALVEAAERDGTLGGTFNDIAHLINKEAESRDRMRNAMAYPLLLSIAVLLTLMFMITYLTPAVKPLLVSVGEMPGLTTQALFWLAEERIFVAMVFTLFPGLVFLLFILAKFSADVRIHWHRYQLLIWIVGDVRRDILYARLCRVVGRLLDSGLDMDRAIAIASNSIDNRFINSELYRLRRKMQVGNRFSQSLVVLTSAPMVLEPLMSAAESSGNVAPALQRVSHQLDEQARTKLTRFTTLVPPVLVCALGFILLALVTGLLAPILSSALTMGASL